MRQSTASRTPGPAPAARRLWAAGVLGILLPALLFCGLGVHAVLQSRHQYEQRAELLTQNLAGAVERSVSANIEKIDLALSAVVDHLEHQLQRGTIDHTAATRHIRSQSAHRVELEGVRVTDAQGNGILGKDMAGPQRFNFTDREWFQVQRDRTDAGFHMSRPLISKVAGTWIISFSRRYRLPDGGFAGAVSAAVPLSYFERELQGVDVGLNGRVSLRDLQMGLIARHALVPPGPLMVGSRDVPPDLPRLVRSGLHQGSFRARAPDDQMERITSYRRLGVAPLLVTVSLASEDYLTDWRGEVRLIAAFCAATVLLYGMAGGLLLRTLAQNRRAQRRIELLAKVFEHSGEAIMLTDSDDRIIEVNPAFVRQTGYAPGEIIGLDAGLLQTSRTPAATLGAIRASVRDSGQWRGEIWDRHKSGREYPKWLSISVLRDAAGQITHHICSSIDVTDVKLAEARMQHLAHHDTLTQLPNRVYLLARLEQAMADAHRQGSELAMLFIDMDHFKNINDTLGHQVGDGLLVEVGQRLRALVRGSDIVARLGGDEFVLVLTGVDSRGAAAAASVAHKLLTALGQPYLVRGHELHSTPSIGISVYPADGDDADTLMKNADTAMYHAKSAGRNDFQFFTPAMNAARGERLALEVGLRSAIERQQLSLHYQPQLDLASGRVVGLEALLRWQHPELGWIPPLKFIPIAEDTGLIERIGSWVLEQALAQAACWRAAGHDSLRVAVNLSAHQLRGEGFAIHVAQALQRHQLPGQALELEITESVAMRDPARTVALLHQLRAHGVALAIDDFGTGYSSLAYLKQLPLSCLKLDRSFVMDIEHDSNDAAICTATIQMAHSLGLAVVAEGVETAEQLAFLHRLGCDTIQGYYISEPLPAADCQAFLQRELATG
jgi:diguanylate cyclase (GGDEF)-like protein/PAS domain S-box-containing protein